MPTYEYKCVCSHEFEASHPYKAPHPSCPKCQGKEVERLISAPIITRVREIRTVGQQGEANYKRDKNKIKEISQMKREDKNGKKA